MNTIKQQVLYYQIVHLKGVDFHNGIGIQEMKYTLIHSQTTFTHTGTPS